MKAGLYYCKANHCRLEPVINKFTYPLYMFALKLSDLEDLNKNLRLFGYNRKSVFSIWDRDYLGADHKPLKEKVGSLLEGHNLSADFSRVILITVPRFFSYVFNPVSFYCCYDSSGLLKTMIAEVSNTFGDTHTYLMDRFCEAQQSDQVRFEFPKEFYVSPFFDVSGDYEVILDDGDFNFKISVNIHKNGKPVFKSSLSGRGQPLTSINTVKTVLRYPLRAWSTMTRIHLQAFYLHFFKKLPFFRKPETIHPSTYKRIENSLVIKIREMILLMLLSKEQRKNISRSSS
jgi:DUF1365 family protein